MAGLGFACRRGGQRSARPDRDPGDGTHHGAGAGGYHNLHSVIKVGGEPTITPVAFKDSSGDTVTLERYCDDRHGFLRLEVTDKLVIGRYFTVPRPQEPYSKPARMIDYFEFDWRRRRCVPNAL